MIYLIITLIIHVPPDPNWSVAISGWVGSWFWKRVPPTDVTHAEDAGHDGLQNGIHIIKQYATVYLFIKQYMLYTEHG